MAWKPFERIRRGIRLDNAERSAIHEIGIDDVYSNSDKKSIDWGEELPDLIKPTIKNLRLCANKSEIVNGIIEDLIIKSISGWVIEGDNEEAVKFIEEEAERMDFLTLFHEVLRNNIVDGSMYHNIIIEDNVLSLRELAYDGENYRIKKIFDDETGTKVIGYKQVVLQNKNTNKGWLRTKFDLLKEDKEKVEFNFSPDEVIESAFFQRHGKNHGLVENVLDEAYMLNLLLRMMPQIVFKQTNTMILTGGNKDRKEVNLGKRVIQRAVDAITNYHRKGVVYLPYGLEANMIGDTQLPKLENYCNHLKEQIFIGLFSPQAIFDGSSSNRSTAVVQLDSDKSGRVLLQQYIQEKLKDWAQIVIDKLLELREFEKGSVWINFNPEPELGEEGDILDENGNVSTSKPNDGLNLNNIRNGEGRLAEVSS